MHKHMLPWGISEKLGLQNESKEYIWEFAQTYMTS